MRFDFRRNSLNTLRLIFAISVIFSHSWRIGGFGEEPSYGNIDPGGFAVAAFFVASGFLITGSRERSSLSRYAWARVLRIYPAFWVCLLVTAFLIAPLAGLKRGGWSFSSATSYFLHNFRLDPPFDQSIGETLNGAYRTSWNGSLWTLPWEFASYVLIGVFLTVKIFRRGHWILFLFLVSTAFSAHHRAGESGSTNLPSFIPYLLPFFLAGAVLYRYRFHISAKKSTLAGSVLLMVLLAITGWDIVFAPLPLAFCVIWLSSAVPVVVERFGDGNFDISYGMYIYGMPVQQLLVVGGVNNFGVCTMIGASVLATALPATLSWYLVEKPCLKLKRGPPTGSVLLDAALVVVGAIVLVSFVWAVARRILF